MMRGLIVALITPFLENGDLDLESFKRLIQFQIKSGTKGLVLAGTTGESPTITSSELDLLTSIAVKEANGKILIFAGVGSYDTKVSVAKTLRAKEMGADGGLVIFPYYNRPGFEGCLAHFRAISDCGLPMMVYYNPGRTCGVFSAHQLAAICSLPSVVALKDCSGSLSQALEVMNLCKKTLFSGDDSSVLPFIEGGAQGLVSVLGNLFPHHWNLLIESALEGDMLTAKALYEAIDPLCRVMSLEVNPQCIKYAMSLMGHCSPVLRLPMMLPQKEVCNRIEEEVTLFQMALLA